MNAVIYTDVRYFESAIVVFEHLIKFKNIENVYYYTVDFYLHDVTPYKHDRLLPIRIDFHQKYDNFYQLKPLILLESLRLPGEQFLYVDTDLLLSKRFENFVFPDSEYPMSPWHYWEQIFGWVNGIKVSCELLYKFLKPECKDTIYVNNEYQSMHYVQACVIAYTRKHKKFIEEVNDICLNPDINVERWYYLPWYDETAYNTNLWAYGVTENLGPCCICQENTITESWEELIEKVENGENVLFHYDWNPYAVNYNSDNVMFYHGIKGVDALLSMEKIILK